MTSATPNSSRSMRSRCAKKPCVPSLPLEMIPKVLPASEAARDADCPSGGAASLVGSSTCKITPWISQPGRLAVNTGADRPGDRAALVAEPGRDHGAEPAGGATGRNHEQLV